MLTLEEASGLWNGYCSSDDQFTLDGLQKRRKEDRLYDIAEVSQRGTPRPLLWNAHQLPICGSRCLVMYDMAGETYNDIEQVMSDAAVLKFVQTPWFIVSLDDLDKDSEGKTIQDLLGVYLSALDRLHVSVKGRTIIVVYAKADKYQFPHEVEEYLLGDPLKTGVPREWDDQTLRQYLNHMREISERLELFTREQVPGGKSLLSRVRDRGLNIVFTAVSATGEDPGPGSSKLRSKKQRVRVLDPLLWAILLPVSDEPSTRFFDLVLDSSSATYADAEIQSLWDSLTDQSDELSAHYLGQTLSVSSMGQRPPTIEPPMVRSRLIGPILEHATEDAFVVVLSAHPIADLADFANTSWRDRLLLARLDANYQPDWPRTVLYMRDGDHDHVVETLLALQKESERLP